MLTCDIPMTHNHERPLIKGSNPSVPYCDGCPPGYTIGYDHCKRHPNITQSPSDVEVSYICSMHRSLSLSLPLSLSISLSLSSLFLLSLSLSLALSPLFCFQFQHQPPPAAAHKACLSLWLLLCPRLFISRWLIISRSRALLATLTTWIF